MDDGNVGVKSKTFTSERVTVDHSDLAPAKLRPVQSSEACSQLVVIDRRTFVREALCTVLREKIGKQVMAVDGVDALASLPGDSNSPSTVIVYCTVGGDLNQRRDDLARIRNEMAQCRICVLTDELDRDYEELFAEYGLQGVIPSSFNTQQILACLSIIETGIPFLPVDLRGAALHERAPPQPDGIPCNDLLQKLTPRQQQVMRYIARGRSNKYIAAELSLCESTVKVHVSELMKRLGATSRTHAVYLLNQQLEPTP